MEWVTSKWSEWGLSYLSLTEWASYIFSTLVLSLAFVYLRRFLIKKIEPIAPHSETHIDDIVVRCLHKTSRFFLCFLALVLMAHAFKFHEGTLRFLDKAGLVVLFVELAVWGKVLITFGLENYFMRRNGHPVLANGSTYLATYGAINITAQFLLFALLLLLLLDNLGVNITALVTGLGIGGIAVALAVQNILGDILASLTIILDKPFEAGDFIIVGKVQGTVESVGLKTTRIRSLSGEQWIYPNKQLIESGVQNYKRMNERRIQFVFGLSYETSIDLLEEVSRIVKKIIEEQPNTRFERAHLKSYGESSLDYEVVYHILSADYIAYMDTQQTINIELLKELMARDIDLAYTTKQAPIQHQGGTPSLPAESASGKAGVLQPAR